MGLIQEGRATDPVLTRIVDEDKVRWWKKSNLRLLYLLLYPTCMGIEITSGFDSQMINGLQLVTAWNKCQCHSQSGGFDADINQISVLPQPMPKGRLSTALQDLYLA
jgi:hypothetical protein